jgi:hypothetical protein
MTPGEGPELATEQDAVDLMAELYGEGVDVLVVPVERFAPRFFDMRTALIGHFFSKVVMWGFRMVVLGDISRYVEGSDVLRDVVYESNRGKDVWFLGDLAELDARLARVAAPRG